MEKDNERKIEEETEGEDEEDDEMDGEPANFYCIKTSDQSEEIVWNVDDHPSEEVLKQQILEKGLKEGIEMDQLDERFREDEGIVLESLKQNTSSIRYIGRKLLGSSIFLSRLYEFDGDIERYGKLEKS